MTTYLIALTSITYAMKAQSLLKSMGYYCETLRTPKNFASGCGYSIRVKGNIEEIIEILNERGIKTKAITEAGAK